MKIISGGVYCTARALHAGSSNRSAFLARRPAGRGKRALTSGTTNGMQPADCFPALDPQGFAGNPLDRSILSGQAHPPPEDLQFLDSTRYLVVCGTKVFCTNIKGRVSLVWLPHSVLSGTEVLSDAPIHLLGGAKEGARFAVSVKEAELESIQSALQAEYPGVAPMNLRSLLITTSREDAAMAGQAVALINWHVAHQFCPRCGSPTQEATFGTRRKCAADSKHVLYPRTDPVVIMLVESPDGQQALLGRSKKLPPKVLTCLSGFIDQAESIEEAVRREVFEEVGLVVGDVKIAGSQPWPIGRGGSCELMIGAIASATSTSITLNQTEMEEAAWHDRSTLKLAIAASAEASQAGTSQPSPHKDLSFYIPPPIAIAHSIIKAWAVSCLHIMYGGSGLLEGCLWASGGMLSARGAVRSARGAGWLTLMMCSVLGLYLNWTGNLYEPLPRCCSESESLTTAQRNGGDLSDDCFSDDCCST